MIDAYNMCIIFPIAQGVVIKYNEPEEARVPRIRWRLYPFKGDETLRKFEHCDCECTTRLYIRSMHVHVDLACDCLEVYFVPKIVCEDHVHICTFK